VNPFQVESLPIRFYLTIPFKRRSLWPFLNVKNAGMKKKDAANQKNALLVPNPEPLSNKPEL
jgi:hypothetical protein